EVRGQRTAGEKKHFESADDPLQVARLNPHGRFRIDAAEHPMEKRDVAPPCDRLEPRAQLGVTARTRKQTSAEGSIVKAGAPHEYRHLASRMDVANRPGRVPSELCRGVFLGGIDNVDQMV